MRRLRPDPVLSDVVRARLDVLLADVVPRRSVDADLPHAAGAEVHAVTVASDGARDEGAEEEGGDPDGWRRRLATGLAFGRRHLVVVAIIAAAGVAWSGWSMAQARTVPVQSPPAAVEPVLTRSATPTPSAVPRVKVHVLGAVATPGVVTLPLGSRVEDALAAAGGLTEQARPGDLNLAAPLTDGAQLVVGDGSRPTQTSAPDAAGPAGSDPAPLDLNTANAAQLEQLPGVGPVTAAAIIAWRTEHGRFTRVEELQEVDGIGPRTFEQLAPRVRV